MRDALIGGSIGAAITFTFLVCLYLVCLVEEDYGISAAVALGLMLLLTTIGAWFGALTP